MSASTLVKNLSVAAATAVAFSVAGAIANAPSASAAIFAVGDSARWGAGGENTLSNLGFNMVGLANNAAVPGGYNPVKQISSPSNTLSFSNTVYKAFVGSDWAQLQSSRLTNGSAVYFNGGSNSTTITLAKAVAALDLVVETNSLAPLVFNIALTAFGGGTQQLQTQGVRGDVGGKYFGFYATGTDLISSITIAAPSGADGFAMGEFRLGDAIAQAPTEAVPEPATIAGTLVFGAFAARSRMKRKAKAEKNSLN